MSLFKTLGLTIATAGTLFAATLMSANAGPGMGSSLVECYNNWINYCDEHTAGYPNNCYTESLNMCDETHSAAISEIPGYKVQAMKRNSLRKAKPARATLKAPAVNPVRLAN
ncbi:hypothetical protein JM93_00868 [Roseibium hamelinense]|uniref:Uncharacterized protein n=1 Tax=Roseibium hamelinense TaxID=150831 RepID=A0A562TI88_9HYPH|nr:hypothetical protein [Roseibium hamelinense]MTI42686.1 hypothetical protein [Roseibium hamelinense]TWI93312.1 hypothetical protein JM93_00868 [Roseibium hamelinense]